MRFPALFALPLLALSAAPAVAATPDCAGLSRLSYELGSGFRLGGVSFGVLEAPGTMLICPDSSGLKVETGGFLSLEVLIGSLEIAELSAGGDITVWGEGFSLSGGDEVELSGHLQPSGGSGGASGDGLDPDLDPGVSFTIGGDVTLTAGGGALTPMAPLSLSAVALPTPVPAAAPLLLAALCGFAALRRRG